MSLIKVYLDPRSSFYPSVQQMFEICSLRMKRSVKMQQSLHSFQNMKQNNKTYVYVISAILLLEKGNNMRPERSSLKKINTGFLGVKCHQIEYLSPSQWLSDNVEILDFCSFSRIYLEFHPSLAICSFGRQRMQRKIK